MVESLTPYHSIEESMMMPSLAALQKLPCPSDAELKIDVKDTDKFDTSTGAVENVGKRQVWHRGEGKDIEHTGILAKPDDPTFKITPAAGWEKLGNVLKDPDHTRSPED